MAVDSNDKDLFSKNHILNSIDKDTFIERRESVVYAVRLEEDFGLIEVTYVAEKGCHNGDFMKDSLLRK